MESKVGPRKKPALAASSSQPWIEKYRPKNMSEVYSQEEVVQVLRKSIESKNLPHLLFYGPPGTGKTSTIIAMAKELYGPEIYKSRVLELNASDDRGIQIVRDKIKSFAQIAVGSGKESKYPNPPYKIIILDEADAMTNDAQTALRRVMENYANVTRFCLICNYVSRIIEPLSSRCAKFRFRPLEVSEVARRINYICEEEGVKLGKEALEKLIHISDGDLRKAIMYLQSAQRLHGNKAITVESLSEIGGVVSESVMRSLKEQWTSTDSEEIEKAVEKVILSGHSVGQIVNQLQDMLISDEELSGQKKSKISQILGNIDYFLVEGADEHLQLLDMMMQISRVVAC